MGKGIYSYYKERLIEIGGSNKCLYLKNATRRNAYDIGHIFEGRGSKVAEFVEFLWSNRKYPLSVIDTSEKKEIIENLEIESKIEKRISALATSVTEDAEKLAQRKDKIRKEEIAHAIESEITKLKELQRETEEIEKETGRYELFLGYPFVFGMIPQGSTKTLIKAPLLLFPVRIDTPDENTVEIRFNENEKIHINPALIYAYAQAKRINIEQLELEFDNLSQFKSISEIVKYLCDAHIKIDCNSSKNVYSYARFREPEAKNELSVRYAAILGRFPLSNSIYNDYTLLEKKKLTNDAIDELLRTGKQKSQKPAKKQRKQKKPEITSNYVIKTLDYAQSQVVKKVDEKGNMVIYGPPGTGKSQTIVNIISDALCKKKRVLVVSQKKAALDVVYNRLGILNEKCIYINDEAKEKKAFYERCLLGHQRELSTVTTDMSALELNYKEIAKKLALEENNLEDIFNTLNDKRDFGLSLAEMYASSQMIPKNSQDYTIYQKLLQNKVLMSLGYKEISDALLAIKGNQLESLYYNFIEDKAKNPLIDLMQPGLDIPTLAEVKESITEIQKSRKGFFNVAKHPYYRQIMAYYKELYDEDMLDELVKLECRVRYPDKIFTGKYKKEIKDSFEKTLKAIDTFAEEYACLRKVLTEDGYIAVIDNILRGNTAYIRLVQEALDNYIAMRDISNLLDSLDRSKISILNFAYSASKNYQHYTSIIEKILPIRIYHEIIQYEEFYKTDLSKLVDYPNIRERIAKLKAQQLDLAIRITEKKNSTEYEKLYNSAKDNKDFLYQISKKQKFWSIRRTMEHYSNYILTLFPCWLLSPENVSSILPLTKNLFDLVIFDEASQVFIESTIPTIYRGKNIVVAGDSKQLRPSATFMKRFMGGDPENQDDISVQAALEVDSLLDLAVARYESANLTYHYRSRHSELIDFSNHAFYSSNLQISPNISRNSSNRPIERYKVNGKWIDRKNVAEAKKIVALLDEIFKTRKNNESIGIITFNIDQQHCIADMIDKEAAKSPEFRSHILSERHRIENGEDTSLFIKNLENVQGDERDIIIFSIGYAENNEGRIYTNFGSLSTDGGENRLNVAITRAKSKIIVVTSIEPEELKVETSKNLGPKLLKKYLAYVRAVSNANESEVKTILSELNPTEAKADSLNVTDITSVEDRIKERLEKLGYTVDTDLGNRNSRISLAIYDEKEDRYLLGIELDKDAFASSASTLERDIYKPKFLEERGWKILRIWCRDWWLYPQKVIKAIVEAAESNRQKPTKRPKKAIEKLFEEEGEE